MADALIAMNQSVLGKDFTNVTGWSNVVEDAAELQAFADNLRITWLNVDQYFHTSWSLNNITVSFISGAEITHSVIVNFTSGALSGPSGEDPLVPTSCLLASLIYVGPRPNRGRVYLSGLTEASVTNALWGPVILSDVQTMIESWVDGVDSATSQFFLRIVRRPSVKFATYSSNPVSLVVPRANPANQRRRRLGSS